MDIICLRSKTISASEIKKTIYVLKNDGLVLFPTDTVYGLAGSANSNLAIEKIYQLKRRPKNKPFIVFIPDSDFLKKLNVKVTPKIKKLIDAFWPGAVTFVFKRNGDGLSCFFGNGIAVRVPEHPVVLALLKGFNDPIAVTSANISGKVTPFDFNKIEAGIVDKTDIAINAGKCKFSVVSTIVDVRERKLKILREGAVPAEKIMKVWES